MSASSPAAVAPMPAAEVLRWERPLRRRVAAVSGLAGVLLVGGVVIQLLGPHINVDELTLRLILAHKRFHLDLPAAVLNAIAWLGIAGTFFFLYRGTKARNPQTQAYIALIAIVGAALGAVADVAFTVAFAVKANQFVSTGSQTYQQANHLTSSGGLAVLELLSLVGGLLLAMSWVLVALNAMRVGLLTKFMGYLGMFAAVLFLFPILQAPIPQVVQGYWLLAVAYLLLGRWPSGVPPAWTTGRAEKWPSSQELRERRVKAAGGRAGGGAKPAREPEPVGAPAKRTSGQAPAARSGAKRKRKRRK
jgi:hypothetical protein